LPNTQIRQPLLTNRFYELLPNKSFILSLPRFSNYKTTTEDGSGRTEQSGYQFKIPQPSLQATVKHLCTSRPAGREIDCSMTLKITNAIRKTTVIPNDKN
jgi:hypothetical protein